MRLVHQILVAAPWRRVVLAGAVVGMLAACGQRGPLFLPTDPAAANRATLTQTLGLPAAIPAAPALPAAPASAPPVTGTASPTPSQ